MRKKSPKDFEKETLLKSPSLQNWKSAEEVLGDSTQLKNNVILDCGWGRLFFSHTFKDEEYLISKLREEKDGTRDMAFYIRDPHVVLSHAPHELFLDPSHTYRMWLETLKESANMATNVSVRPIKNRGDCEAINHIYQKRHMITADVDFVMEKQRNSIFQYLVAVDEAQNVCGCVMGIDHKACFDDPESGTSLWCLAVDPQCTKPGIGEKLVQNLCEHYHQKDRRYLDLSVMHNNRAAIGLYEKLGFVRVPVFCVKNKNTINERLFIAPGLEEKLNPYSEIIVNEARRRGILVDVIDTTSNYFALSLGGRSIRCRESLCELTSSISMSICQDKQLATRYLSDKGFLTPAQIQASTGDPSINYSFLTKHKRVVVKPADAEQGKGITVDISNRRELDRAIDKASKVFSRVLIEEFVEGNDLRLVVINDEVVAAAVRKPPRVIGDGKSTIKSLISKQSRRRGAATKGESSIPLDKETERCINLAGFSLDDILENGVTLTVRKTANLHTGGTIHDVTNSVHSKLVEAAIGICQEINIPVAGIDLMVKDIKKPDYRFIEINERPGLANHEPHPTAEKFLDLLFPTT